MPDGKAKQIHTQRRIDTPNGQVIYYLPTRQHKKFIPMGKVESIQPPLFEMESQGPTNAELLKASQLEAKRGGWPTTMMRRKKKRSKSNKKKSLQKGRKRSRRRYK